MVETIQVLRAAHVLFAILWGGAAVYRYAVVEGLLGDDAVASRFFARARHGPFMGITATATVLFGGATMGLHSDAYSLEAIGNGAWILGLGMGSALIAYGVGILGHLPLDSKIRPLAAARVAGQAHDEAAYERLKARESRLGHISVALVGISIVLMLTFRWF